MSEPLRLHFTDLLSEGRMRRRPRILGRDRELRGIARTLGRLGITNVLIVGEPGVGKTALMEGFAARVALDASFRAPDVPYIRLDIADIVSALRRHAPPTILDRFRAAFTSLPDAVVWMDDGDALVDELLDDPWMIATLLQPFFERQNLRLVLSLTDRAARTVMAELPPFAQQFDTITIEELPVSICVHVVAERIPVFQEAYELAIASSVPEIVVQLAQQLATDRSLPHRALRLLDETCADCQLRGVQTLTPASVRAVFADRTGIPAGHLATGDVERLQALEDRLRTRVRGQDHALVRVADTVRRGWLGLRNPSRPIGAFFFLGPSGVGKTETARALGDLVYGERQSFVRLDMSEYADEHTRQRLIGAPPGYVGHDAGGQLTNPIAARPFSLILLDELDKAHPSVADVFLQVLEDGRLTDGKGHTVDYTKTILIATSNLCTEQILAASAAGVDVTLGAFLEEELLPLLLRRFRSEFLNRFDALVVFQPLSANILLDIATLELRKIEERLAPHHIRFRVSEDRLSALAQRFCHPRFGARPLKRYLEELCEGLATDAILAHTGSPQ